MRKIIFFIFCFPLFVSGQNGPYPFSNNGIQREFYLNVPNNLEVNPALVFAFHGWGGNGNNFMNVSGFNDKSNQEGFIVCYPTGLVDNSGFTVWDTDGSSDINFITSLADSLIDLYQIDTSKIFATGFSYGAEMSYHLAECQSEKYFDAIAPVGGGTWDYFTNGWSVPCTKSINLPVFILNGTNDNEFEYNGGFYPGVGYYLSVDSTVSIWTDFNSAVLYNSYNLIDDNNDNNQTEVFKYQNSNSENDVWLYKVNNGSHEWFDVAPWGSDDFSSTEEIWSFFSQVSSSTTDISENKNNGKILIKTINLLGQSNSVYPNSIYFNIFDDGTVEKRIIIK